MHWYRYLYLQWYREFYKQWYRNLFRKGYSDIFMYTVTFSRLQLPCHVNSYPFTSTVTLSRDDSDIFSCDDTWNFSCSDTGIFSCRGSGNFHARIQGNFHAWYTGKLLFTGTFSCCVTGIQGTVSTRSKQAYHLICWAPKVLNKVI
jgi:hypothetical protein